MTGRRGRLGGPVFGGGHVSGLHRRPRRKPALVWRRGGQRPVATGYVTGADGRPLQQDWCHRPALPDGARPPESSPAGGTQPCRQLPTAGGGPPAPPPSCDTRVRWSVVCTVSRLSARLPQPSVQITGRRDSRPLPAAGGVMLTRPAGGVTDVRPGRRRLRRPPGGRPLPIALSAPCGHRRRCRLARLRPQLGRRDAPAAERRLTWPARDAPVT